MKKKRPDCDSWTSITKNIYQPKETANSHFNGTLDLLTIEEVKGTSIRSSAYGDVKISNAGMKWLQILPDHENYMSAAIYDKDELFNAYRENDKTEEQFHLALNALSKLLNGLLAEDDLDFQIYSDCLKEIKARQMEGCVYDR